MIVWSIQNPKIIKVSMLLGYIFSGDNGLMKIKLFSNITFLSLFLTEKLFFHICHCIYSQKYHSMPVDDFTRRRKFR